MKLKLLLLGFLFIGGFLTAQDTIKTLVITEANLHPENQVYLELTNMGEKPIQLNQFELGEINHFTVPWDFPNTVMLPDRILQPGESFVMASVNDYSPIGYAKEEFGYAEKATKDQMWKKADLLVHMLETAPEDNIAEDMVSPDSLRNVFSSIVHGRAGFFLRQHIGDSITVVTDQICGVFDEADGTNITFGDAGLAGYAVAGINGATKYAYLVRRFNVKEGNIDFANARGIGLDDSEWIPIPREGETWRDVLWTTGNHGDYNLDANTLESDVLDINFANKTITVPWGIRRGDDIMRHMVEKPGIGWNYLMAPAKEDSLSFAAATGDKIIIYVCGNDLDKATFDIIVSDPVPGANVVVPKSNEDPLGIWRGNSESGVTDIQAGILAWPRVTRHESGMDTIWGTRGGIPYATRIDSLLERLDKPENASWEIVYSGMPKPDLTEGDKLKVTAENGNVKEYYISVNGYKPAYNANLSAITWPDIPDFYRNIFGWTGDTIPNFSSTITNYKVQIPLDVDGIPAMIATAEDLNAKVMVNRAKNILGAPEDRTITFTVIAEDDTTTQDYFVELVKEKDPAKIQPYYADPIISEIVFGDMWRGSYGEVANPGNQVLDMSNYMIAMDYSDPAGMIAKTNDDRWLFRYEKYIPGYKWQNEANWLVQPYIAEQDLNVNPLVAPGDVFCFGYINADNQAVLEFGDNWPLAKNLDVQFNNFSGRRTYNNPWGEPVAKDGTPISKWLGASIFLYKILNDSIKLGLKPATDPKDFELIDIFGGNGDWVVAGDAVVQVKTLIRKPDFYKGNIVPAASFGTNKDDSEWINRGMDFWSAQGLPWRRALVSISSGIGSHYMYEPTHYKSTVSSLVYKVSDGFSHNESIRGLVTGTTVDIFYSGLVKANENQSLNVKSATNGSLLNAGDVINLNDTLVVLSADSTNATKYILEVNEQGLSSDAVLTSSRFEIGIEVYPKSTTEEMGKGYVKGMEYGTSLKSVIQNIVVPAGASMNIIDKDGSYVPFKRLNYDTTYVNVTVSDEIYLYVTAENGVSSIQYQLLPEISQNEAFVTSIVYTVKQKTQLIDFVPRGTNTQVFLNNLTASAGASIKLVDNMGNERIDGLVADDDKVVITSANGEKTNVYFISKLRSELVPATTYLAHILSNIYNVDQVKNMINGVSTTETISEFYAKIDVAAGANAVLVDKDGKEKTSGDINRGDKVKVTSADGKITVVYTFGTLVSNRSINQNNIVIYPNPTSGKINISGLQPGNRIQLISSTGAVVRNLYVQQSLESLSIEQEPAGMYIIIISSENEVLGQFKAIKK